MRKQLYQYLLMLVLMIKLSKTNLAKVAYDDEILKITDGKVKYFKIQILIYFHYCHLKRLS